MSTPVTNSVNIRRAVSQTDRVRIHERGRICAHAGCDTILSIYNPTKYCTAHVSEAAGARRRMTHGPRATACEACGLVFETRNERRRFCSDRCRMAAFARRKRARQAETRRLTPTTAATTLLSEPPGDAA
jgi:hypothetical protein